MPHKSMPQKYDHDFKECSDVSTTMIIFTSLPIFFSKTLEYMAKTVFSQDVFNMRGFECTHLNIRIFFPYNHVYSFGSSLFSCGYTCIHAYYRYLHQKHLFVLKRSFKMQKRHIII